MGHDIKLDHNKARIRDCEQSGRQLAELTALKVDVARLQYDFDELNSTDITMMWVGFDILEPKGPSFYLVVVYEFPRAIVIPDFTIVDGDGEVDALETNEEE